MTDLLTVVDMAKDYNPELSVKVLLSRMDQRTKDTVEMQNYLIENNLELFKSKITERVAFRKAIGEGAIVNELNKDPSDFLDNSSADKAESIIKKNDKVTPNQTTAKLFRISIDISNKLKLYVAQQSVDSGTRVTESNIVENALHLYFEKNNT